MMTFAVTFVLAVIVNIFESVNPIGAQISVMGYMFPLLPCLIVGSIWSFEYKDRTMDLMVFKYGERLRVFIVKTFMTILSVSLMFAIYVIGLFISRPDTFLNTVHVLEWYIIPLILLINLSLIMIFYVVICRSFSSLSIFTVLIFLTSYFCYKMTMVHQMDSFVYRFISDLSFSGIYASVYNVKDINQLLVRTSINTGFSWLLIVLGCFYFKYKDI
jgi:hypothetical protein